MNASRRIVLESIEIVAHDVDMSDELPTFGLDDPLGMDELEINTQTSLTSQLLNQQASIADLAREYPPGSILTPNEAGVFKMAVDASLVGTGLSTESMGLIQSNATSRFVSMEGLGGAIKHASKAVGDIIATIIKAIVDFFRRLLGFEKQSQANDKNMIQSLRSENPEADQVYAALHAVSQMHASDLHSGAIKEVPMSQSGASAVIEGEYVVVKTVDPKTAQKTTHKIDTKSLLKIPFGRVMELYETPPQGGAIDGREITERLVSTLHKASELVSAVYKPYKELLEEATNARGLGGLTVLFRKYNEVTETVSRVVDGEKGISNLLPARVCRMYMHTSTTGNRFYVAEYRGKPITRLSMERYAPFQQEKDRANEMLHLVLGSSRQEMATELDKAVRSYTDFFGKSAVNESEIQALQSMYQKISVSPDREMTKWSAIYHDKDGQVGTDHVADHDIAVIKYIAAESLHCITVFQRNIVMMLENYRYIWRSLKNLPHPKS